MLRRVFLIAWQCMRHPGINKHTHVRMLSSSVCCCRDNNASTAARQSKAKIIQTTRTGVTTFLSKLALFACVAYLVLHDKE